MSEVKLRLAIRDLYRGDGGPLNDLDQGWNEGVDAAAEILYPLVERAEAEIAAIKAAQQPVGYDTLPDSKFEAKFKHVGVSSHAQSDGWVSEQDAKIKRLSEALRVCDLALSKVSDGSTSGEFRRVYAAALRDAGVKP